MDITFSCPNCNQPLTVDEAGAGLTVPCPKCGKGLTIPFANVSPPEPTRINVTEKLIEKGPFAPSESYRIPAGTGSRTPAATSTTIPSTAPRLLSALIVVPMILFVAVVGYVAVNRFQSQTLEREKAEQAENERQENDKSLNKYGVVNPTKGSEIQTKDLPKYVAMSRGMKVPIIVDGQQVGLTSLGNGNQFKLVKVDGNQATIRVANSDVVVPVDSTDLLQQIERRQKGIKKGDVEGGEDVEGSEDVAEKLAGTWRQENGDLFMFTHGGDAAAFGSKGEWVRRSRWAVEGNAVAIYWQTGGWDKFLLPIDPKQTKSLNDLGDYHTCSKAPAP
ncbi:MAG: hypothetical protein ACLP0A_09155 [Verrucomicrobiia bacterium]